MILGDDGNAESLASLIDEQGEVEEEKGSRFLFGRLAVNFISWEINRQNDGGGGIGGKPFLGGRSLNVGWELNKACGLQVYLTVSCLISTSLSVLAFYGRP